MKRLFATGLLAAAALSACSDAGTSEVTSLDDGPVGEAAAAVATSCQYLDPAFFPPLPIPVDVNRELILRDLGVVEEPCHTTWGACGPPNEGIWTFGGLMGRIAGTVPVQQFVANWLHQWEVGVVVNGFFVPPRPNFRASFLGPWLTASGCAATAPIVGVGACPLDLKKAPFRLLAIVNRVDNAVWSAGPPVRDPEARFVFGMLDGAGAPLQATTIFEFKLPPTRGGVPYSAFDWATAWHGLSNPALGPMNSPGYISALTAILDDITMPGAFPVRPNGDSAIGQVRTNEVAFGPAGPPAPPWKLREFHLTNVGAGFTNYQLLMAPTHQTPDDTRNLSAPLDTFLFNNALAHAPPVTLLRDFEHTVNPALPGGESTAPSVWNHTAASPLTPLERTNFGFATCNGCHTTETNTAFTHISPRAAGVIAGLSPFLSTSIAPGAAGSPLFSQAVVDPSGTGVTFRYNEVWRRVCEVNAILDGAPGPYTRANGKR